MMLRRVIFLPSTATMGAPWRVVDESGHIVQSGRLEPDGLSLETDMPTVAVVSGADVAVRWLQLPKGSPAQIRAVAVWQMGDVLTQDLSSSVVALGPLDEQGRTVVAAVSKPVLEAWMAWLEGAGIMPVAILPDSLCIRAHGAEAVVVPTFGADVVVVAEGLSASVQPDLLPLLLGGRQSRTLDASLAEIELARGAVEPILNLLDAMKPASAAKVRGWRRLAILAACVLVSPLVLMGAEIIRDDLKARTALDQARTQAIAWMPQSATAEDPLGAVESRLADMAPVGGHVRTLSALVETLEPISGAGVREVNSIGNELRATVRLPDADARDVLRDGLAARGLAMKSCDPVQEDGALICNLIAEAL